MNTLHNIIFITARIMLASYFLKAGVSNFLNFPKVIHSVRNRKIPFPYLALVLVIVTEILGSVAIIFNTDAYLGAIALIIFTIFANIYYCNYWKMQGADRRNINFLFYSNLAVIGGLLLIAMQSLSG